MTLVKLYNNEERERSNFAAQNKQLRQAEFSIDKKTNLLFPLQEISFLILTLLIVSLMAYLFVKERTGSLASYMIYFYLLRRSQQGMGVFNSLKVAFASISGPVNAIKNILSDEEKYFVPQGNVEFKGLKEKIEYNHLNFSYYKDRQIIHDLSFSIEKGKKVALVGATGAGKTTLVSLLLRFYDCPAGSVLIDGVDIRSFTTKSLLERFACVSQETLLFSDTLRANIVYGLKSPPSDEALSEALKKARLSDFVASLPQGLETYIGDRGVKLSGGEKQRVAITRAMLKAGEILILDEATSSLDSVTERLIQEAIEEVVKDKTVIVIAHRLSTVKNTDKIVVIESGRFIEEGTLQQLIDKKGKFYEYWQEQKFY
jgi:subfamily B ATP-binding cassette protein MsbA